MNGWRTSKNVLHEEKNVEGKKKTIEIKSMLLVYKITCIILR